MANAQSGTQQEFSENTASTESNMGVPASQTREEEGQGLQAPDGPGDRLWMHRDGVLSEGLAQVESTLQKLRADCSRLVKPDDRGFWYSLDILEGQVVTLVWELAELRLAAHDGSLPAAVLKWETSKILCSTRRLLSASAKMTDIVDEWQNNRDADTKGFRSQFQLTAHFVQAQADFCE